MGRSSVCSNLSRSCRVWWYLCRSNLHAVERVSRNHMVRWAALSEITSTLCRSLAMEWIAKRSAAFDITRLLRIVFDRLLILRYRTKLPVVSRLQGRRGGKKLMHLKAELVLT